MADELMPAAEVVATLQAAGMTARTIRPPTNVERFRDQSTVIVCPTKGKIDYQVVDSWLNLSRPMNAKRAGPLFAVDGVDYAHGHGVDLEVATRRDGPLLAEGYKVAEAYNALVEAILVSPNLKNHKYLMTIEDDNILPWNAHLRLLETLEAGPDGDGSSEWDAVGALYFVKCSIQREPMAYGDAASFRSGGTLHFKPIDLASIPGVMRHADGAWDLTNVPPEHQVIEVCAVAQGATIFKLDLFRELPPPWFVTIPDQQRTGTTSTTQDVFWSHRLIDAGKRLAVDLGCLVGHKDVETGEVY